jgi:hypothetical protein
VDDPFLTDPTAKRWAKHVIDEMVPKMEQSSVAMALLPDGDGDVKFWVELGAMICMNKPIIAVVIGDREIPPKLELVADEVVRCPDGIDPIASEELAAAVTRVMQGGNQ